jgi:SPP1 family predicted phage head-tail adaptor
MATLITSTDLNRLVMVQEREMTQDSFGGQSIDWTDVKQVYAKIRALTGKEIFAAQAVQSEVTHEIIVRYDAIFADPKVAAAYRLVYNSRIFDVSACMNEDEADQVITLLATEGLSDG